jgi:hypothetical protein
VGARSWEDFLSIVLAMVPYSMWEDFEDQSNYAIVKKRFYNRCRLLVPTFSFDKATESLDTRYEIPILLQDCF